MSQILRRAVTRNNIRTVSTRQAHWTAKSTEPSPPKPPKKAETIRAPNGETWVDNYHWMSQLDDKANMRRMEMYIELEGKYIDDVLSRTARLQSKLQAEVSVRVPYHLSTPASPWGPWLYYRRVEQEKPFQVLCRRLASLHEEFISNKSPSTGFDFTSGQKIEQRLIDYNQEAERFGGFAYDEVSEVSPDHHYIAYTMFDKDSDIFKLQVRDLNNGSLCDKLQADRVSNVAWSKNGRALYYVVTDDYKRPCKLYRSILGSDEDAVCLFQESRKDACLSIRHTKDYKFIAVYVASTTSSQVYLIDSCDPSTEMSIVWEGVPFVHCVVEHHGGHLYLFTDAPRGGQPIDNHYLLRSPVDVASNQRVWEDVFVDDPDVVIEDVEFCNTHLVLIIREGQKIRLCAIPLPLRDDKTALRLLEHRPCFLPLPKHVCRILPGSNYDFESSTKRFTISSPVMPDAVVDYDLSSGKWNIIQQQNLFHESTKMLYGKKPSSPDDHSASTRHFDASKNEKDDNLWNELSMFYACEKYYVSSHDGALIPLTVICSHIKNTEKKNPVLLHGHGSYGELLDKRWRSEMKSLLDRGWALAYADVRGGGGRGKKWHHDGRRTKKHNSVQDFLSCANFLVEEDIAHEEKLAAWGVSAGGLLVASAINSSPHLFRAAVLKNPFLDPTTTLLHPILPLTSVDFEEFGYLTDTKDFQAVRSYSPYDNIREDSVYPAVLISSSLSTRFGLWEAAKYAARVRERTVHDPTRPILLNVTADVLEENRYLQSKELALEMAFLLKMIPS